MQIETIELVGGTKARAKDVNDNISILKNAIYTLEDLVNAQTEMLQDLKRRPTRHMFDVYFSLEHQAPTGAYPLWTGEWINHCDSIYPEFWDALSERIKAGVLSSCSAAAYEESLKKYGQCGQFVFDELNGKVRLPKITRFISSVSTDSLIGSCENDAIRNITGSITGGANTTYFSASSGAFYRSSGGYADSAGGSGSGNRSTVAYFDASKCVPTASENRPKNVRMGLYIQISNNTAEVSTLNTQLIAESLASAEQELTALKNQLLTALSDQGQTQIQSIETSGQNAQNNVKTSADLAVQNIERVRDEIISDFGNLQNKMDQVVSHSLILSPSNWANNEQSVFVSGMRAESIVWVSPAVSSDYTNEDLYGGSGIWCKSQGDGTLTFGCKSVPSADLYVTVVF